MSRRISLMLSPFINTLFRMVFLFSMAVSPYLGRIWPSDEAGHPYHRESRPAVLRSRYLVASTGRAAARIGEPASLVVRLQRNCQPFVAIGVRDCLIER